MLIKESVINVSDLIGRFLNSKIIDNTVNVKGW